MTGSRCVKQACNTQLEVGKPGINPDTYLVVKVFCCVYNNIINYGKMYWKIVDNKKAENETIKHSHLAVVFEAAYV